MSKYNTLTLLILVVLSASINLCAGTEEPKEYDRAYYAKNTKALVYSNESGRTMHYRLFLPKAYDSKKEYPLLLSLHGAGSRGDDNLKQLRPWVAGWLDPSVQEKYPCIILMPQCPVGEKWVNTPWKKGSYSFAKVPMSTPMKLAKEILDKVIKEEAVDRSRIYIMGASMGGYGTWNFTMRYPDLFAAAVPICGGGDPSMAHVLKNLPIWAFHGDKDKTVPLSGSEDMVSALKIVNGTEVKFTIYGGVGHDSYTRAWREPKLIQWLFNQQKVDKK